MNIAHEEEHPKGILSFVSAGKYDDLDAITKKILSWYNKSATSSPDRGPLTFSPSNQCHHLTSCSNRPGFMGKVYNLRTMHKELLRYTNL